MKAIEESFREFTGREVLRYKTCVHFSHRVFLRHQKRVDSQQGLAAADDAFDKFSC